MATSVTTAESGVGQSEQERIIENGRFERACTEDMAVTFTGPGIAEVASESGNTYEVELGGGVYECKDYEVRGDRFICKHVQRACLSVLFDDNQHSTKLVARVARFAHTAGCEHGVSGCAGPTTTADRLGGLPGQECIGAVRAPEVDEFTVWTRLVAPEGRR